MPGGGAGVGLLWIWGGGGGGGEQPRKFWNQINQLSSVHGAKGWVIQLDANCKFASTAQ